MSSETNITFMVFHVPPHTLGYSLKPHSHQKWYSPWGTSPFPLLPLENKDLPLTKNNAHPLPPFQHPPTPHLPTRSHTEKWSPSRKRVVFQSKNTSVLFQPYLHFSHKTTLEKYGRNSKRTWFSHFKYSKFCKKSETLENIILLD